MAFLDDVVGDITARIATIGLSTTSAASGEVSGSGYAPQAVTYGTSTGGSANITAVLEFNGPANGGPVTHLIFRDATSTVLAVRPLVSPVSFNSDGRLNVTSAPVTAEFGS